MELIERSQMLASDTTRPRRNHSHRFEGAIGIPRRDERTIVPLREDSVRPLCVVSRSRRFAKRLEKWDTQHTHESSLDVINGR
jgi:hypothetical protein